MVNVMLKRFFVFLVCTLLVFEAAAFSSPSAFAADNDNPYGLIGFRYRCADAGQQYPGHAMWDGGGNQVDVAVSNYGPWVKNIDDWVSNYCYDTGGALNDAGGSELWAGRGIFVETAEPPPEYVGIPRVGEVPWWIVTYDDDPNQTEEELRASDAIRNPETADKYLAMVVIVEAAEGIFQDCDVSDFYYSSRWARMAAASLLVPFYYGYFSIDPTTGYIMANNINSPRDATCRAVYDADKMSEADAAHWTSVFNQGIITLMEIVDTYMHYEKTGEIVLDTCTGGTAKELLAAKYPQDNLVVSSSPVRPADRWGYRVKSAAGNYASGSSLQSIFWVSDKITWRPAAGYIDIHKATEDMSLNSGTLSGFEFRALNLSTNIEVSAITDTNGLAHFELEPGTYRVYEVAHPKYSSAAAALFDQTNITVVGGATVEFNATNYLTRGGVKFKKFDFDLNS